MVQNNFSLTIGTIFLFRYIGVCSCTYDDDAWISNGHHTNCVLPQNPNNMVSKFFLIPEFHNILQYSVTDMIIIPSTPKTKFWVGGVYRNHLVCPSVRLSVQNSCPVHIFLMEKHWKILLHTKNAYELWVYHDLDSRSFGSVQGHCFKQCLIPVCGICCINGNA